MKDLAAIALCDTEAFQARLEEHFAAGLRALQSDLEASRGRPGGRVQARPGARLQALLRELDECRQYAIDLLCAEELEFGSRPYHTCAVLDCFDGVKAEIEALLRKQLGRRGGLKLDVLELLGV